MHRKHVETFKLLFASTFIKNNPARFNVLQWTGNENWTVKCAVLMELLQKNTFITDINLWGQKVRKTVTIWSLT